MFYKLILFGLFLIPTISWIPAPHPTHSIRSMVQMQANKKRSYVRRIRRTTKDTFAADCYSLEMRDYLWSKGETAFQNLKRKIMKKAKLFKIPPPCKGWFTRNETKVKKFWLKTEALNALNMSLEMKNISGIESAIETCQSLEGYDFSISNKTAKNAQIILHAMEQLEQLKGQKAEIETEADE